MCIIVSRIKTMIIALSIAACLVYSGCSSDHQNESDAPQTSPEIAAQHQSPSSQSAEMVQPNVLKYLSAAGGYLSSTHDEDAQVANAMAGVSTGNSTMTEVKHAFERAQTVNRAAFSGDYASVKNVPQQYMPLDAKIRECNHLHEAAFIEFLEYWNDQNPVHIESGASTFKRAGLIQNDCINEVASEMARLKK